MDAPIKGASRVYNDVDLWSLKRCECYVKDSINSSTIGLPCIKIGPSIVLNQGTTWVQILDLHFGNDSSTTAAVSSFLKE